MIYDESYWNHDWLVDVEKNCMKSLNVQFVQNYLSLPFVMPRATSGCSTKQVLLVMFFWIDLR